MTVVAGVDLGGTKILAAIIAADHKVGDRAKLVTPTDGPAAVVDAIVEAVEKLDPQPDRIGVGVPGPVVDGVLRTAPNLVGFTDPYPMAERLEKRLDRPVAVDNDATVGTIGEWAAGAGRHANHVLGVWMGTGVGGGLILDGRPYRGDFGGAGEFGHTIIHHGGALCGCGRRGCVEAYAGRGSMETAARTAMAAGVESRLADTDKPRMTSGVWAKALAADDELAVRIMAEAVQSVAVGIASVINLLDLARVVIGGGLAEKLGQDLADEIGVAMQPYVLVPRDDRRVVVAELGDDSGVVGAAHLARMQHA